MKKFFIRLLINAFGFFIAMTLLRGNGIESQGSLVANYLALALVFGVVNAVLRPILMMVGCPVLILTLGLGTLLINTLLFYLTGLIGLYFGFGFTVDGFLPAFLGALIVSAVGFVLGILLHNELKD